MFLQEGKERSCSLFWAHLWHCKPAGDRASPDTVVLTPVLIFAVRKYLCTYEQRVRLLIAKEQR